MFPGLVFAYISKQVDEVFPFGAFAPATKFMILNSKLTDSFMNVQASGCFVKGKGTTTNDKVVFGPAPAKISNKMSSRLYQSLVTKYDRLGYVISSLSQQRKEIGDLLFKAGGSSA